MLLAIALIILVIGSIIFHFASPWWFTPIASNWSMIDDTINITFWVTGIVFVAVNLFMAYAVLRFRHKKGQKARYEPENKKLEWWLTGVTAIGVVAMLDPGSFRTPEGLSLVPEAVNAGREYTFIYYSFVTLTTLGYGEITPASHWSRTLAWTEAVIGQLFLAILVARLVGLHIVHSARDE